MNNIGEIKAIVSLLVKELRPKATSSGKNLNALEVDAAINKLKAFVERL